MEIRNRTELYKRAIEKWGERAQMEMAQEEATELATAIRKQYRKNTDETFKNLVDEVADVEIMIEQIEFMHDHLYFRDHVENRKKFKLNRLQERLDNNSFE